MKWIILIALGVLGSMATLVLTAELGHTENNGFQEDDGDTLEEDYRQFIDNDPDVEEMINKIGDIMLDNWFKKAGHSMSRWFKKAGHDTKKWIKKAVPDAGKWIKKAVPVAVSVLKKGCKLVNAIPSGELVPRMKESLRSQGISEEELSEEQAAAVYKGVKDACQVIG
ncbi:uncharacterized protein LOC105442769 [Strongylocentrotus purpuratus]|uniref:Uncharacterized protein n=1 Tax=Strongylocentrotus purpuratus TaxID=7668 RepID=A0A7M7N604_STRPU|nr:uncharacterized protein LOC105442769 [Strongylocentrotus purpuratus]